MRKIFICVKFADENGKFMMRFFFKISKANYC